MSFLDTGFDEDTACIKAGKEFALIRTVGGKVNIYIYIFNI